MLKCKNDPTRKYKGTEPSPKGLGYCAHSDKVGKERKGKDGNKWIVKEIKNGSKRWMKVKNNDKKEVKSKNISNKTKNIDCSKFRRYELRVKSLFSKYIKIKTLEGLKGSKNHIYKIIDYNTFEEVETKIPKGYKSVKVNKKWMKEFHCDNKKELIDKNNILFKKIKSNTKGFTKYLTHWNGGRPYLVYIKKNEVYIYKQDNKQYYYKESDWSKKDKENSWMYIKLVKHYKTKKIFIGKDSGKCNGSSLISSKLDVSFSIGNTILLQLTKNRYVFIEGSVYEFSTNDEIVKYFSLIGNNDVPYPVALGKENVYFMLDNQYIPKKYFPKKMKDAEFEDSYYLFYNQDYIENNKRLLKDFKKINFKKYKNIDTAV